MYVVRDKAGLSVRAVDPTSSDCPSATLIAASAWRHQAQPPKIFDIKRVGQRCAFGTDTGAFLYDPVKHTYQDASLAIFRTEGKDGKLSDPDERQLARFRRFDEDQGRVVVLADGFPLARDEQRQKWIALDYRSRQKYRRLVSVVAGTRWDAYALDDEGGIHKYYPTRGYAHTPQAYCTTNLKDR